VPVQDLPEVLRAGLDLVGRSQIAMLGSNGPGGYPEIKAMLLTEAEGLGTLWFGTNTSSRRVRRLAEDPRASVYLVDQATFAGLLLVGDVELRTDQESRERLWQDGWERYYPQGVTDPDFTVLRFSAHWGNYYHGLRNTTFLI
jgi:general stress protein 26